MLTSNTNHFYILALQTPKQCSQNQMMNNTNKKKINQNKLVVVMGNSYKLTEDMYNIMKYFPQSQAIQPTDFHQINSFPSYIFDQILAILKEVQYSLPEPPPNINSTQSQNFIGQKLARIFNQMTYEQLNNIYKAAHYLKIIQLRRCVSAHLACKVYMKMTITEYNNTKKRLGVERDITNQKQQQYKERFPFIN